MKKSAACPVCGKLCAGEEGVYNHSKAKHPLNIARYTSNLFKT
jgi:hypothetical protein